MPTDPTPERRRELLRDLTQEAVEAGTYGQPAPERTPQDDTTEGLRERPAREAFYDALIGITERYRTGQTLAAEAMDELCELEDRYAH